MCSIETLFKISSNLYLFISLCVSMCLCICVSVPVPVHECGDPKQLREVGSLLRPCVDQTQAST